MIKEQALSSSNFYKDTYDKWHIWFSKTISLVLTEQSFFFNAKLQIIK